MCVVPVKFSHATTKKEVPTLAMLDNCSQGTFLKQRIKGRLDISGRKTDVFIKTLNGERSMESEVVTGLRVSKEIRGEKMQWLSLPPVYTRDELPDDIDEVATCEKAKRWDHLKAIADNLPISNMKISLLIGANCARAYEPVEVFPSQDRGIFAYKTFLVWCVVGPLKKTGKSRSISCNDIAVQDAASSKVSPQHFEFIHEVRDVSAKKMLQEMYNADFIEPIIGTAGNIEEMSYEDQKFLKLMDENARKIGKHYQLPLPFRDKTKIFPNTRKLAEKRLGYLQRRFMNNITFFEDYKRFIEDLLNKEYARKSKQGSPEGKIWYIPHDGVFHPSKSGKIRVMFDCSAEYRGISLKKSLMSGPDLTNQILRVITRFRQEPVVIMGDIQAMFHQVLVPEIDRSLLRFLWWENHDISKAATDYEIGVHVFGATSSPSCCNYALKRTAVDSKGRYPSDVAKTLQRNFYVDDLLNSVSNVGTAIRLLNDVIEMCAAGGFRLAKIISNRIEVLQSIAETERKNGVKNVDPDSGAGLPTEKALGINWNIENDQLSFKVKLNDKPMTRRRMLSTINKIYDLLELAGPFLLNGKKILQDLCRKNYNWDDAVPDDSVTEWENWNKEVK